MKQLKRFSLGTLLWGLLLCSSPAHARIKGTVVVPDSILSQRDVTLGELLRGRVAGLQVLSSDGAPGEAFEMIIRGGGSIRNGVTPLIYLDDIVLNSPTTDVLNPWAKVDSKDYQAVQNLLNGIPSNDIESIEVISDIAGVAAYGAHGANGVIRIKTKNGRSGRKYVEWNSNYGVNASTSKLDLARLGFVHNQNINIQGSHNRTNYFLSATGTLHNGVLPRSGTQNLGLNVKLEQQLTDRSRLGVQILFFNTQTSMVQASGMPGGSSLTTQMRPFTSVSNETSADWLTDYDDNMNQWRMAPQLYYTHRIIGGLNFRISGGIDYVNKVRFRWMGTRLERGLQSNSRAGRSEMWNVRYTVTPEFNYNFLIGKQHEFNLNLNGWFVGKNETFMGNYGAYFTVPSLRAKGIRFASQALNPDYLNSSNSTLSGSFSANYNFAHWLNVDAGYRISWMPQFNHEEVNHYPFAQVTGHFFKPRSKGALNDLSVKVGWGISGNNQIGNYNQIPLLLNEAGAAYPVPQNALLYYFPQIKSENNELNVGVDLALLNNRLKIGVNYYDGKITERLSIRSFQPDTIKKVYRPETKDTLVTIEKVNPNHYVNTLSMKRQGVEVTLSGVVLKNKNTELTIGANAAWNHSIINGYSPCLFYGYESEDATEQTVIGSGNAPFLYGVQIGFRHQQFSVFANFDGTAGNQILNLNGYTSGKILKNRIEDGSFFRFSNLSINYNFPIKKNKWIKAFALNATATNLFTVTRYSGFSPDVNSYTGVWNQRGVDCASYPASGNYMIGFSAKF